MAEGPPESDVVEIKPEVVFLYEILQEVTRGQIQIPRFQRAFVWRHDQMTELLDSINKQYPVGSLLVWETEEEIATLERLGPFIPVARTKPSTGYLLDGHQRLMTLAGALLPNAQATPRDEVADGGRWNMFWNVRARRFQHRTTGASDDVLFPMTSLLDTVRFFDSVEELRKQLGGESRTYVQEISVLARTFQSYRIPVIRIRQTGLAEAVEIFARLNSRGQGMTADQMVSALTFRQADDGSTFDLASEIDGLVETMAERNFGEVDRGTLLRAILATLDEDIYRTDWTKLAHGRREDLQARLQGAVVRTSASLGLALDFLVGLGVRTGRLLPYGLQLVLLSAFFDKTPEPTPEQAAILSRWFWVSSFSAWFGGANPSRISALIDEFRQGLAEDPVPLRLENFDLSAEALPLPTNFDMRSARTRALLLVMLAAQPLDELGPYAAHAIEQLSVKGPAAVGSVYREVPREFRGNPANRLFRPRGEERGPLVGWLHRLGVAESWDALESVAVPPEALEALQAGNAATFLQAREATLTQLETKFQLERRVTPSTFLPSEAPVDTD